MAAAQRAPTADYWIKMQLQPIQLKEGRVNIVRFTRITLLFPIIEDLNNRGGHSTSLIALLLRDVVSRHWKRLNYISTIFFTFNLDVQVKTTHLSQSPKIAPDDVLIDLKRDFFVLTKHGIDKIGLSWLKKWLKSW